MAVSLLFSLWATLAVAQSYINPPQWAKGYVPAYAGTTVNTVLLNSRNPPTDLNAVAFGAITTWNITLPNPPYDGQIITVACPGGTVSTINISTTDGSSVSVPASSCNQGSTYTSLQFAQSANSWQILGSGGFLPIAPTNSASFNAALNAAVASGRPGVALIPGTYTVSLTGTGATSGLPYAVLLNNPPADFTIDGQGSTLVLNSAQTTPGSGPLGQNYSQILQIAGAPFNNKTILKNLTLKWSVPPFADTQLTACAGSTATFQMQGSFAPDWPSVTRIDQYNPTAVIGATFGATVAPYLIVTNVYSNGATPIAMTNAGGGSYTLNLTGSGLTCGSFTVNNFYRLMSLQFGYSDIGVYQSGNLVFDNVRIVNGAGQGFTIVGANAVQLLNGVGTYKPSTVTTSTNAGGFVCIYCSGNFYSDPGTYLYDNGDESLNIVPYQTAIVTVTSRTNLTVGGSFPGTYIKVGDTLQFIDTTGTYQGSAVVTSFVGNVLLLAGSGAPAGVANTWVIFDQSQAPPLVKVDGGFFGNNIVRCMFINATVVEINHAHCQNVGSVAYLNETGGLFNLGVVSQSISIDNFDMNNVNYANDAGTAAITIENRNLANTAPGPAGQVTEVSIREPHCQNVGSSCYFVGGANRVSITGGSVSNWFQLGSAPALNLPTNTLYNNAYAFFNDTKVGYGVGNILTGGLIEGATNVTTLTTTLASANLSDASSWTAYTPVASCGAGAGTWGTVSGRYKQYLNKITAIAISATLTTIGTCATSLIFTLPNTSTSTGAIQILYGRENQNTGTMLQASVPVASTNMTVTGYNNTAPIASGDVYLMSGTYENQ